MGGTPIPDQETGGGGTPPQVRLGEYSLPGQDRDIPPSAGWVPPSRSQVRTGGYHNWNSMTCTCYVGGMPLAFTQEDLLVNTSFYLSFIQFLGF